MIVYLLAGVAALAMLTGIGYKVRESGKDSVRVEWQAANVAAQQKAEAERQRQDALRAAQDKEATRRLADARKRSTTLMASLEAHIRAAGPAAQCGIPDSLRDAWNSANKGGESVGTGTVPPASGTAAPAR